MNCNIELVCPVCHKSLHQIGASNKCIECGTNYPILEGIPILIPPQIDQLSLDESKYHDEFTEDPVDVHQLNTLRNEYYHALIREEILREGVCFLEVGGGGGYDARQILKREDIHLVETDISAQTLLRSKQILANEKSEKLGSIQFVSCAISALPFPDQSFDVTFCVAAIHHLSDVAAGLKEMRRVSKENGKIIIGLEPNRFYFRRLKTFRRILCNITHTSSDNLSRADAELEGYSEKMLRNYFNLAGLRVIQIIPAWFTLGIIHYALEFAFRSLRLSRRIKAPHIIESAFLYFDRFLFSIPKLKYFCWHWIVFAVRQ